ncbi:MAG TPA: M48 family metallopeptidase [Clostridiales bacterium]|nr:M48 family metallopeptidase [Clostridiales bacterium]
MVKYELIRSMRKTLSLHIRRDGSIVVKAPLTASIEYINCFINRKQNWIQNTQKKILTMKANSQTIELSSKEEALYKMKAKEHLQLKCQLFSRIMGIQYGTIKINGARTRWGSCNSKGDINFSYRLIFAPEDLIDYVVVHELTHIKEMNHSANFWAIVEETMPDYKERRKRLRDFQYSLEIVKL